MCCSHRPKPLDQALDHSCAAGALNLFGGVLTQKRRAEEALEASSMVYTIVRPGGMERPGDDYKATHNVTLAARDTLFGGQVSRLQVAEVVGAALRNLGLAENKVPLLQNRPRGGGQILG